MIKFEKYTGTKTYLFPNGEVATPEIVRSRYPGVDIIPHVVETDGIVLYSIPPVITLRNIYKIDDALTDDEAITLAQTIRNAPAPPPEPTAEERMAAAMEFQNLLAL